LVHTNLSSVCALKILLGGWITVLLLFFMPFLGKIRYNTSLISIISFYRINSHTPFTLPCPGLPYPAAVLLLACISVLLPSSYRIKTLNPISRNFGKLGFLEKP
jgi:hypothetical protein